jgi:hypothetical protein
MKITDIRRKYLKEVKKGIFIPPKAPLVFNEEYVTWLETEVLKLNLACVIVSVCDCTHTQACSVCGESKGIDMRFLDD